MRPVFQNLKNEVELLLKAHRRTGVYAREDKEIEAWFSVDWKHPWTETDEFTRVEVLEQLSRRHPEWFPREALPTGERPVVMYQSDLDFLIALKTILQRTGPRRVG